MGGTHPVPISIYVRGGRVTRWRTMTVYDALRPATRFPPATITIIIFVSHLPGQHEQEQRHAQVRCRGVHPDAER